VDVGVLFELQGERFWATLDPDFDFRVEVEVTRCFFGEVIDAFVRDAGVFPLLACHALFVHEKKPEVGEHDEVAKEFVGVLNFLSVYEELGKFILQLRGIDLRGIANKSA
jgi:hypothetical protein